MKKLGRVLFYLSGVFLLWIGWRSVRPYVARALNNPAGRAVALAALIIALPFSLMLGTSPQSQVTQRAAMAPATPKLKPTDNAVLATREPQVAAPAVALPHDPTAGERFDWGVRNRRYDKLFELLDDYSGRTHIEIHVKARQPPYDFVWLANDARKAGWHEVALELLKLSQVVAGTPSVNELGPWLKRAERARKQRLDAERAEEWERQLSTAARGAASDGGLKFSVTGVKLVKGLSDGFYTHRWDGTGRYVLLDVRVENHSDYEQSVNPMSFTLVSCRSAERVPSWALSRRDLIGFQPLPPHTYTTGRLVFGTDAECHSNELLLGGGSLLLPSWRIYPTKKKK